MNFGKNLLCETDRLGWLGKIAVYSGKAFKKSKRLERLGWAGPVSNVPELSITITGVDESEETLKNHKTA